MEYLYPAVGAIDEGNDVCRFVVWAPERSSVDLLIEDKSYALDKDDRGYWSAVVKGVKPYTRYKYQLDHAQILPDPASRAQPEDIHGPSMVVPHHFEWHDSTWKGLPLADMVIYELHVGTFTNEGTFEGVIQKLDHLKTLGINAIELMPVAQFPGARNWGYDGVYPFAVQHSYGGASGLKKLVDAAHQQGIAVILDVVYNHQGPEGNYLSMYGPYFTDKYKTGWGQAINYDDAWCDGVRHFYWQNALMWLDEFHIDGLRLDAVHAIWDFSANHFIQELTRKVKALELHSGRKKVLIAEFDLNNPRYISGSDRGGYGLDGQWIDEFHHALHSLITGEVDGYYEDFGDVLHLVKAIKESYVYTGEYSKHRKKLFGVKPEGTTYDQFVVFAQNHDQVGNRMLGDRLTTHLSHEGSKLAAATVLLSPQIPMLFMGEEYGEKNPFQYFISHTDENLVALVRKGRKEEFSYFQWEGEVPDPFAEETFNKCKLSWTYNQREEDQALFKFYQHLIHFRKTRPAMKIFSRDSVKVSQVADKNIIVLERIGGEDYLLIVLNFEKSSTSFPYDDIRPLRKIFDSSAVQWKGPGETSQSEITSSQPVLLNPQSAVVFEQKK